MQVKDSNRNRRDYGMLAAICLVVQVALAPNIGLGNGRANMGLVFCGIISLAIGGRTAVISSFFAGLLFDLSTTGPIGLMSGLLTLGSFFIGGEARNRFADDFSGSMQLFSGFAGIISLIYHVTMLLVGDATNFLDVVFLRALPTTILTVIVFAPFAYLISRSTGSSLSLGGKTPKSAHMRGSRYDIGDI